MVLAVTELEQSPVGTVPGREGADGGGVHSHGRRGQVIDPDQESVVLLLERRPDGGLGQRIEHVGQAIVVEILGPHRLAQAGREHLQAVGGPTLEVVEPMVAGGDDVGQPDAGDLAKGQGAGPIAVGGEMVVPQGGDLHALELSQQQRQVIDAFDVDRFEDLVDHAWSGFPKRKRWSKNSFRPAFYERWCGFVHEKPRRPVARSGEHPARNRRVNLEDSRVKEGRGHSH